MNSDELGGMILFFVTIILSLMVFILLTRIDISSQKSFQQGSAVYQCKKINELVSER